MSYLFFCAKPRNRRSLNCITFILCSLKPDYQEMVFRTGGKNKPLTEMHENRNEKMFSKIVTETYMKLIIIDSKMLENPLNLYSVTVYVYIL